MRLAPLLVALALTACGGGQADRPGATTPPAATPAAPTTAAPTTARPAFPKSMAALGDSITRAFVSCGSYVNCPGVSWATGDEVRSHARRLRIGARDAHNFARSGAPVGALPEQAARAVAVRPEYVTVLMGVNDACRTPGSAAPVAEFARDADRALTTLAESLPRARVLVLSIPDLYRLWRVLADDPEARASWRRTGLCRGMFGAESEAERLRVRERVVAYNAALAAACAEHRSCRWDRNAVFGHPFVAADISRLDFFHPSEQGQETLAEVAWRAGYWATS